VNSEYAYDLSVALCASSATASYREFEHASEVIFGITVPRYRKVMLFMEYRRLRYSVRWETRPRATSLLRRSSGDT